MSDVTDGTPDGVAAFTRRHHGVLWLAMNCVQILVVTHALLNTHTVFLLRLWASFWSCHRRRLAHWLSNEDAVCWQFGAVQICVSTTTGATNHGVLWHPGVAAIFVWHIQTTLAVVNVPVTLDVIILIPYTAGCHSRRTTRKTTTLSAAVRMRCGTTRLSTNRILGIWVVAVRLRDVDVSGCVVIARTRLVVRVTENSRSRALSRVYLLQLCLLYLYCLKNKSWRLQERREYKMGWILYSPGRVWVHHLSVDPVQLR